MLIDWGQGGSSIGGGGSGSNSSCAGHNEPTECAAVQGKVTFLKKRQEVINI